MVRIGIVGCNYGRAVHVPTFRLDPRGKIVAIAATERAPAAETAASCNVPLHFGSWRELVEHSEIDAVVIAAPWVAQPQITVFAPWNWATRCWPKNREPRMSRVHSRCFNGRARENVVLRTI